MKFLIIAVLAFGPSSAFAQFSVNVDVAPPPLPVYDQPACPDDGYLWVPGYWAYGDYGYYWVPGTWVLPPDPGLLWTPGYWGWGDNGYAFNPGYWGQNVGFYGGIDYGYGYGGDGYGGGRWQNGHFFYNTAVNNVAAGRFRNTYADNAAVRNVGGASFNGGSGGVQAQATEQQRQYASEHHYKATAVQVAHVHSAALDRGQLASANGGRPATPASATPKAYKAVALQHVKSQPLSRTEMVKKPAAGSENSADRVPARAPVTEAKTGSEGSFTGENTHPAESHNTAEVPREKPATVNSEPHPQTEAKPESRPETDYKPHPETEAKPQPRPEAQAKPAPRPEAPASRSEAPATHAEAPASHAAPAGKPEGEKQQ